MAGRNKYLVRLKIPLALEIRKRKENEDIKKPIFQEEERRLYEYLVINSKEKMKFPDEGSIPCVPHHF